MDRQRLKGFECQLFCSILGINSGPKRLNLQYFPSNEKMTISTLLKTTNLKHLLKALISTYHTSPLPFYLLKMDSNHQISTNPDLLFLNRSLSNAAIHNHPFKFSVWSPQHLQRLRNSGFNQLENKVVIANPYKSDQLIKEALNLSVREMVINSVEEYKRIQKIKNSYNNFKGRPITYYWAYNSEESDIQGIRELKNEIKNVIFERSQFQGSSMIEMMTHRIIEAGVSLDRVICSGSIRDSSQLKQWKQSSLGNDNYKREIELKDVTDIGNYFLAAKSKGRGALGIDASVREMIGSEDYSKSCLMVNVNNQEWLISKIAKFPLHEEPFLFEMGIQPNSEHFQIGQASIS